MSQIQAGIVTFNPDITLLEKNIVSIIQQVKQVVIVDNASKNISQIKKLVYKYDLYIIENSTNLGIATALNQIMSFGIKNKNEWVLTLDQDSVCPLDYIESMKNYLGIKKLGMIAPIILDRNIGHVGHNLNKELYDVRTCITSGALTNVNAWTDVNGYDDKMFIDSVDFDFCYRIRKIGYRIVQTNTIELNHAIGNGRVINFLLFKIRLTEHSAFRNYYISQNEIYYPKKNKLILRLIRGNFRNLSRILVVTIFEKEKKDKIISILKGWRKGYTI